MFITPGTLTASKTATELSISLLIILTDQLLLSMASKLVHCQRPRWNLQCHPALPQCHRLLSHWATNSPVWRENIMVLHSTLLQQKWRERREVCLLATSATIQVAEQWLFIVSVQLAVQNEMCMSSPAIIKLQWQFHWNFSTRSKQGSGNLSPSTLLIISIWLKVKRN